MNGPVGSARTGSTHHLRVHVVHRIWPYIIALALIAPFDCGAQQFCGFRADLVGQEVVPPTTSHGIGVVDAVRDVNLDFCLDCSLGATMLYVGPTYLLAVEGTPLALRLCRGSLGQNGDCLYTIPADSIGVTIPISLGEHDCIDLVGEAIYCVLATDLYPEGEIRGQLIYDTLPAKQTTWGKIRALYR